jgi:formamidopyrimidine-DNA glycosylase
MPELPEVETVVRGLRHCVIGRTIARVRVHWPGSIGAPDPERFVRRLTGRTVTDVARRGKWIVIAMDDGQTLLVHLRMTGQLLLEADGCPEDRYTRVVFDFDDDPSTNANRLRFSDMRKFGRLILTRDPGSILGELGPEPLGDDFTVQRFQDMLAERRGRIKSLLLDQRFLAGLGNIYVNEALWRARVHPLRPADSLSAEEVAALHRAIRTVLRSAIAGGGTTLENGNFRQADGEAGDFAGELLVYGRGGEECECCGVPIQRITVGQRGTYFCPGCQPPLGDE